VTENSRARIRNRLIGLGRRARRGAPLVLLAIALVAVACGGGSSEDNAEASRRLSKQEYVARADAICRRLRAEAVPIIEATPDLDHVDEGLRKLVPHIEQALEDLRALRPPRELEPKVQEWMRINETAPEDVEDLADVYESESRDFESVSRDVEKNEETADQLAADIGLTYCAKEGLRG
jgi:hypothetical protein